MNNENQNKVLEGLVSHWPLTREYCSVVEGELVLHDVVGGYDGRAVYADVCNGWTLFNGKNSHVIVGNYKIFDFGKSPFSISCWFNANEVGSGILVMKGSMGRKGRRYDLHALSQGHMRFCIDDNGWRGKQRVDSHSHYNVGEWYHLTGVRGAEGISFYVNGKSVESSSSTSRKCGDIDGLKRPLVFGIDSTSLEKLPFSGKMRSVRIYNRVLTSDDIEHIYKSELQ